MEFVQREVSERPDIYAVPGGPVVADAFSSSLGEARTFQDAMQVLAKYHDLSSIWLIAHEGCAYYRGRYPTLDRDAVRGRQMEDLRRAKPALAVQTGWAVRLVYAALEADRVVFATIDD